MDGRRRGQRFLDTILGDPEEVSLSNRVLNAATFCSTLISGGIFLTTFSLGVPTAAVLLTLSAFAVNVSLYGLARRSWHPALLVWVFLFLNSAAVGFDWVFVGGMSGLGLSILVVLFGLLPLLLPRKAVPFGFLWILLTYAVLYVLSLLPGVELPQPSPDPVWVADRLFDSLFLALGLAMMTGLVMASHQRQEKEIRALREIIPICAYCRKIRNDEGYFEVLEEYFTRSSGADFSHTYCPDCLEAHFPDQAAKLGEGGGQGSR